MKKIFNTENLIRFIFFTFIASTIYVVVRIVLAPTVAPSAEITIRVKSDYVLMLVQCLLGVLALLIPRILKDRIKLNIPNAMIIAYAVFLYCAIYLGEVRNFYYRIPHWDTILHTFSGVALGALGFFLVNLLNKPKSIPLSMSPVFIALFAFFFALALGAMWEMYEFTIDYFLHTNSQKYALESGQMLVGQDALMDTMKDLVVDALGALVMSLIGFFSLKKDKRWIDQFQITVEKAN